LLKVFGTVEKVNTEFKERKIQGKDKDKNDTGNVHYWLESDLKELANRPRLLFVKTDDLKTTDGAVVQGQKITLVNFIWGHDITLANYNGTVLQTFEFNTKLTLTNGEIETDRYYSAEGFLMQNGKTKVDLQTIKRSFDPTVVKSLEIIIKVKLGAGLYDGKGVTDGTFAFFDSMVNRLKPITWQGEITEYQLRLTADNMDKGTFNGPFDNLQ